MTTPTASAPPSLAARIASLQGREWTKREAEWLALVCLHSGVFTRSQYQACYGLHHPAGVRFVRALMDANLARETPFPDRRGYRPTGVCHVHGRSLYRALGIEHSRHRKRATPEITMRRLLSLDYVLEHQDLGWLPTEPEKLAYFQGLGIPVAVLPRRVYHGPCPARTTRRYFALKLPLAGSGTDTTFVFADTGSRNPGQRTRILPWAATHVALWDALREHGHAVHVAAVTRTGADAAANAEILESWRGEPAPAVALTAADEQLLDAVELAKATGDLAPLAQYGGAVQAANAALALHERLRAARARRKYIDAYSTHVAERLAPDLLSL